MVFGWRDVKYIMVENRFTRRWYLGWEPRWNMDGGRRAIALLQKKAPLRFVKWGGVLHFLAVVVYILHRKVNDIPEFLQVFLHILHFCQIRRTSPGCCRSASVWLGDAAELGRMRCRSGAAGQGVPRFGSRPEHGEAANTFPCPLSLSSVGLHGLLFAGAWLRVAGLVGLV